MKAIFVNHKAVQPTKARTAKIVMEITKCSDCPHVVESGGRAEYSDYLCDAAGRKLIEAYSERSPAVPQWCPFADDSKEQEANKKALADCYKHIAKLCAKDKAFKAILNRINKRGWAVETDVTLIDHCIIDIINNETDYNSDWACQDMKALREACVYATEKRHPVSLE